MSKKTHPGFTILELLIAIVILGGMLTLTTSVVIATIRFYAFVSTSRQNQEDGRNIMYEISRVVQYGRYRSSSTSPSQQLCIFKPAEGVEVVYKLEANKLYKYVDRDSEVGCSTTPSALVAKIQITPNIMKVKDFSITEVDGARYTANTSAKALIMKITFISGGPTTGSGAGLKCVASSIYCSELTYTTAISADNQGS